MKNKPKILNAKTHVVCGRNKKPPTKNAGEKGRSQRKGNFNNRINALKKLIDH